MLIIYLFSVLLAQAVCEYRVTPDFDLLPQRAKDSVDRLLGEDRGSHTGFVLALYRC